MASKKKLSVFDMLNSISEMSDKLTELKGIVEVKNEVAAQRLVDANESLKVAYQYLRWYLDALMQTKV